MTIEILRRCDLCKQIVSHLLLLGTAPYVAPTPEWLICGECESTLAQISEQDIAIPSKYRLQVARKAQEEVAPK